MSTKSEADLAREILKRVSQYLDALAGHVFDIEKTIGEAVTAKEIHDDDTIKNLQVLDFLRQSLEDLAMMSVLLGDPKNTPLSEKSILAVHNKLKLKCTQVLLGETPVVSMDTTSSNMGDIDLF